ncbi:unnamed protein product [Echinostoma caproni]|uniref:C2H2-type domain-containing protein n=1 Tax=Echinostoma caproni TaxID=27848 RepID=A0A182ZZC5_9TREM|nr:unnamed protein product [Echinostoma caproni]
MFPRQFFLVSEGTRKPDTSVLQHAAEQLWSRLKADTTAFTVCASGAQPGSNALSPGQPRAIVTNVVIITTGKPLVPTNSQIPSSSTGPSIPIKIELLTTPTQTLEKSVGKFDNKAPNTIAEETTISLNSPDADRKPSLAPVGVPSSSNPNSSPSCSSFSYPSPNTSSPSRPASTATIATEAETQLQTRNDLPTSVFVKTEDGVTQSTTESGGHSADPTTAESQPAPVRTGQYTCFTCRQHFQSHTGLKRHNLALHVTQALPCDQCVKVFR